MLKTLPLVLLAGCSLASADPEPDPLANALANPNFKCTRATTSTRCVGTDGWAFLVTDAPSLNGVVFHSFEARATDKSCADVKSTVDKLANKKESFFVLCDTDKGRFDFQTYVPGGLDPDYATAIKSHLAHRASALATLKGEHAIDAKAKDVVNTK